MQVSRGTFAATLVGVVVAGLGVLGLAGTASAASGTGTIYVVHGIEGRTLDLFVDGENICPTAEEGTVVGPKKLAAGQHTVSIKDGATTVTEASFDLGSGANLDLVAHLRADSAMTPTVTVFPNDLAPVPPGKGRLVVAHVAAAPPADARVDGEVLFRNIANGESLTLVVPAKKYSVDVVATGTDGPVIGGPATASVQAGALNRVFVYGSTAGAGLKTLSQVIKVPVEGAAAPSSVPTGDGGQAAARWYDEPAAMGAAGGGAVVVGLLSLLGYSHVSRRTSRARSLR
jgi:hypothetical protein